MFRHILIELCHNIVFLPAKKNKSKYFTVSEIIFKTLLNSAKWTTCKKPCLCKTLHKTLFVFKDS